MEEGRNERTNEGMNGRVPQGSPNGYPSVTSRFVTKDLDGAIERVAMELSQEAKDDFEDEEVDF